MSNDVYEQLLELRAKHEELLKDYEMLLCGIESVITMADAALYTKLYHLSWYAQEHRRSSIKHISNT